MEFIIFTILISFGLIYLNKDFSIFILVILFIYFIFTFLLLKLQFTYAPMIGTVCNILVLLAFLYRYLRTNITGVEKNYVIKLSLIILITFTYMFILSASRNVPSLTYIFFIRNFFYGFLLFFLFLYVKDKQLISDKIVKILWLMLAIQVILALLQMLDSGFLDFFKIKSFGWKGEIRTQLGNEFNQKLVLGSLLKTTNFAVVISILTVYLFSRYLILYERSLLKLIILIVAILLVFLSGIRNGAITIVLGIFLVLWIKNKKTAIIYIGLSIMLIATFKIVLINAAHIALNNAGNFETPFQRIFGLFVFLDDSFVIEQGTVTLFRSKSLIPEILKNPLFGPGKHFLSFGGGYSGIESVSDAYLLFLIAEFGILGITILLLPYLFVLKILRKSNAHFYYKITLIIFILLVVQTIVDQGLFLPLNNFIFFIIGGISFLAINTYNMSEYS